MRITDKTFVSDRFLLKERIGDGGQGEVYLARDLKYRDPAAIKRIRAQDPAGENEARLLSRIRNPYIPSLRSSFIIGDYRYLCMDYIRGKTLKEHLKRRIFSEAEARHIALRIAQIFSYLHHLSPPILYLDLKPANIILDENQNVYLIDFGIARQKAEDDYRKTPLSALTRGYAAPEQYLAGHNLDERTDLYSIGVLLHYLLTNKNPNDPPYSFAPVRKSSPKVSAEMEGIVKKLLQPEPEARYQTTNELLHALQPGIKDKLLYRLRFLALPAAVGLFFILLGLLFSGKTEESPKPDREETVQAESRFDELIHGENTLSIHPAGGTYETYQFVQVDYPKDKGILYYTLDGSRPTKDSAVYTDGIVISAPHSELRVLLIGPHGEEEAREDYRIERELQEVEVSLSDPAVWDLYYLLKKPWEEPLYTYELAAIRSLPESAKGEDHLWLRAYMPYLEEEA